MKSVTTSGEAAETPLQQLLGVCNRNPIFTLQRDRAGGRLLLFYGAELLESFPEDPEHFSLRLCAGRLYNAGLPRKALSKAFDMDIRTIRRVAVALVREDAGELLGVLQGRQRTRKLTLSIQSFVLAMCETAFAAQPRAPTRYLREKVQEVFGVSLSAETLRPLLAKYRASLQASQGENTQTSCDPPEDAPETTCGIYNSETVDANVDAKCVTPVSATECPPADRKRSVSSGPPRLLPHAGLALFLPQLTALAELDPEDGHLLRQLTACILLGAVNLEQTKTLDHASLAFLLGPLTWTSPSALRKQLHRLARRTGLRQKLLAFNARFCGHSAPTHVFFDPHTKHYTGQYPVLPGWISSLKRVDKAIHGDWFHGPDGSPLWHRLQDNYDDLRARFLPALRQFREEIGLAPDHPLCVVVDRGIHGRDTFLECQKEPGLCLLTWDQAYRAGNSFLPETGVTRFEIHRRRNHSQDLVRIRVEAWEVPHPDLPGAGRIVFRLHRDGKDMAELALLRLGPELDVREAVERMTARWLQENDFKYQSQHFGLDHITSYSVKTYTELQDDVIDRQTVNGLRKALQLQARDLRTELGILLLNLRDGKRRLEKPMREALELQEALDTSMDTALFVSLSRNIQRRHKRLERDIARLQKRHAEADELEQRLVDLRKRIRPMPAQLSRLATLIEQGMVRHDLAAKTFLDTLRMIARNLFCRHLKAFRSHYDNLRDDHVILRALTHSAGIWIPEPEGPRLHLHPGLLTSRRNMQSVFDAFLSELPPLVTPDSPPMTLLTHPAETAFELAIQNAVSGL